MKPTTKRRARFVVTADGDGVANHAGSAALAELADVLGLTSAYSNAMAPTRRRRSAHDPGWVLRDLVVMLANGGDCVADLAALRDQPELFGEVASTSTAWRVVDAISEEHGHVAGYTGFDLHLDAAVFEIAALTVLTAPRDPAPKVAEPLTRCDLDRRPSSESQESITPKGALLTDVWVTSPDQEVRVGALRS